LGLITPEHFQVQSSRTVQMLIQKGTGLGEVAVNEWRFAVTSSDWPELGRSIVVRVDPKTGLMHSVFNGHVPPIQGYGSHQLLFTKDQALAAAQSYEGGRIQEIFSELGWFTAGWMSGNTPTAKVFVWRLKTISSVGGLRDFIVGATTGSVLYASDRMSAFVNQVHEGYVLGGTIEYSSLDPNVGCPPMTCSQPAFGDSLISRDIVPKITSEWETRTTPGNVGTSGWWRVPPTWLNIPRLNPFQNNFANPATDFFTLVVADTSTTDCSPYPPPCGNGRSQMFYGMGDTDGSVYGHEYGHNLLNTTNKMLVSQVGATGQTTETLCDIVGVAGEDFEHQRETPCFSNSGSCTGTRSDFKLTSVEAGTIDLTQVASACTIPRGWIGPSWFHAMNDVRTVMLNDLSGAPITTIRDWSVEVTARAMLEAFDIAPDMFPDQMDVYSAAITAAGNQWVSPATFLRDELASATSGVQCP
jgi:hypothetical protein